MKKGRNDELKMAGEGSRTSRCQDDGRTRDKHHRNEESRVY